MLRVHQQSPYIDSKRGYTTITENRNTNTQHLVEKLYITILVITVDLLCTNSMVGKDRRICYGCGLGVGRHF